MVNKRSIPRMTALAVVALLAAPASAVFAAEAVTSKVAFTDGAGDVWRMDGVTTPTQVEFPPADVTRAVVRHGARAVVLRMRFVDLKRVGDQSYSVDVRTPEHEYSLELFSKAGARGGRHRLANDGSGEIIGCRGLTHEIDYADNVISLRTPRRCLDKPRWVKARIMNMVVVEGEPTQYYIDNPRNDQGISEAFTKRLFPH